MTKKLKIIGITQRVDLCMEYDERRDCLDQRWGDLARKMNWLLVPLSNSFADVKGYFSTLEIDGLIFSGGNNVDGLSQPQFGVAPERDAFEYSLIEHAIENCIPILGICRGFQMLTNYFNGEIVPQEGHVNTNHAIYFSSSVETPVVNSYHSFSVKKSGADWKDVATSADGSIEFSKHKIYPFTGIMWHPEREATLSELSFKILKNIF